MNARSKQVRRDIFALSKANGGYHYGGALSCVEILIALYDHVLSNDDRFILSKGHACWGLYVLLRERGYNPALEGHPRLDLNNGVHWTTGSEGHGLPAAVGMALARKLLHKPGKVYVLIGDGECQEGTTWECLLMAVQHQLNNLVVIMDNNGLQACAPTADILNIDCFDRVAEACGWNVESVNGHDDTALLMALTVSPNLFKQPYLLIANTIKGKGVSYMENDPKWHACWPSEELVQIALEELA